MPASTATSPPTRITVVESDSCHFCADAELVLTELAGTYPLLTVSLDVRSPEGADLMARHRAAMSPLVLLDGRFFSQGRLPRRKLSKILAARYGGPSARGSAQPMSATISGD